MNPTFSDLWNLLASRGHAVFPDMDQESLPTDVWPPSDSIVTIALGCDPTLLPSYRRDYFVCKQDEFETPIIHHDPAFGFADAIEQLLEGGHITLNHFAMGPMKWLLTRLKRHTRLLAWPRRRWRSIHEAWRFEAWEVSNLSAVMQRLVDDAQSEDTSGPLTLALTDPKSWEVLMEIGSYVGRGHRDFYVSDLDGTEVYMLHHHDKVVVSIPVRKIRDSLIEEARRNRRVFDDRSCYECPSDSDFFDSHEDQSLNSE